MPIRIAIRRPPGKLRFIRAAASRSPAAQRVARRRRRIPASTSFKMFPPNSAICGRITPVKKDLSSAKFSLSSPGNSRL
jgi:hypothetical protein